MAMMFRSSGCRFGTAHKLWRPIRTKPSLSICVVATTIDTAALNRVRVYMAHTWYVTEGQGMLTVLTSPLESREFPPTRSL